MKLTRDELISICYKSPWPIHGDAVIWLTREILKADGAPEETAHGHSVTPITMGDLETLTWARDIIGQSQSITNDSYRREWLGKFRALVEKFSRHGGITPISASRPAHHDTDVLLLVKLFRKLIPGTITAWADPELWTDEDFFREFEALAEAVLGMNEPIDADTPALAQAPWNADSRR